MQLSYASRTHSHLRLLLRITSCFWAKCCIRLQLLRMRICWRVRCLHSTALRRRMHTMLQASSTRLQLRKQSYQRSSRCSSIAWWHSALTLRTQRSKKCWITRFFKSSPSTSKKRSTRRTTISSRKKTKTTWMIVETNWIIHFTALQCRWLNRFSIDSRKSLLISLQLSSQNWFRVTTNK